MSQSQQYGPGPSQGSYPPPQYGAPQAAMEPSPQAIAALVLGIVGLLFVPVIPPIFAWVLGAKARNRADRGEAGGRTLAVVGMILGIVGTALAALGVLIAIVAVVIALATS